MATACSIGGASLGFYDIPDDIANGTRNAGVWAETVEATKKVAGSKRFIQNGKFEAVGFAPLPIMNVEPDIVQVWGNPVQMLALVYANTWDGSEDIQLSTNGHGASCNEVLTVPYLTGKIRLALPDIGDRRFAYAADNEMIMGIPISHFERIVRNLKESYRGTYKLPYAYYFHPIAPTALARCKA
jgi:uncharacterized protein (DUF169 family)